jgi:hypothetical protein
MTGHGSGFAGKDLEHYEDCVRSIPAIVLVRLGNRPHEAHLLYIGLERDALERGIEIGCAWGIFSAAAMGWLQQTWVALADASEHDITKLLYAAIEMSVDWAGT